MPRIQTLSVRSEGEIQKQEIDDLGFNSLFVRDTNQLPRIARMEHCDKLQFLGIKRTLASRLRFERLSSFLYSVLHRYFSRNADQ